MTLKEIREHIENMKFFNNGDQIILALSGGPDSACLFYVLNQIKSELDLSISCVHVNHGLRGKASDADEDFVRLMCKQNNCNLRVVSADINALANGNFLQKRPGVKSDIRLSIRRRKRFSKRLV